MLILELCFRFFCCGLFAIGGGLATLPFLYNISKETGWYTFNDSFHWSLPGYRGCRNNPAGFLLPLST